MITLTPLLLAMLAATDDAPLPRAGEVIARLEKTEAAIKNLSVTTEYVKLQKDDLPVSEPIRLRMTATFIVDHEGRTRHERVGEQVNRGADGVTVYRGRWRSTYDGKVAASLSGPVEGPFLTAEFE